MKFRSKLVVLLVMLLSVWGCSDNGSSPTDPGTDPSVTYSGDIQPLFNSRCLGCHGLNGSGDLDLRADVSFGNLVNIVSLAYGAARVLPTDADNSVLYDKVSGGGTFGARMPLGGMLSTADIEMIQTWITEGALDN